MQQATTSSSAPIRSRISIRFAAVEGALTRTLMALGSRGWSVIDMHARREDGGLRLDAELEATPKGTPLPALVLERQLARLHDVLEVSMAPSPLGAAKVPAPC